MLHRRLILLLFVSFAALVFGIAGNRFAENKNRFLGLPTSHWRSVERAHCEELVGPLRPIFGDSDRAAIPVLLDLLGDDDPCVRASAAQSLGTMNDLNDVAPVVMRAAKDPSRIVRMRIALALTKINSDRYSTIPLLIESLSDHEICVRIDSAEALGLIGPKAIAAIGPLTRALEDDDSYVRMKSAEALYRIAGRVDVAILILVQGLKDDNSTRRRGAAQALRDMGPDAKEGVTNLIEALQDEDLRFYAAEALGAIGPDAKLAFLPMMKMAQERRDSHRSYWWLRDPLMKIDPVAVASAGLSDEK
jgi:HEAT repeat protein